MATLSIIDIDEWCDIIEGEYREMPGLSLTRAQIQRLWGLDLATTDAILARLTSAGCLHDMNGEYVLPRMSSEQQNL
jgi:hypothetical protein